MNPTKFSLPTVQSQPVSHNEGQKPLEQQQGSKLNLDTRASQSKLLTDIVMRPLSQRKITVDSLISRDGLTFALGKASRYAKLKDAVMRGSFKIVNLKQGDRNFGSLHKASLRLADDYHSLVQSNAPESKKLTVLRDLRKTLTQMQDKHVGTQVLKGRSYEEAQQGPIKDLIGFVDHEIGRQPSEHVRVANEMMTHGYGKLKSDGTNIPTKVAFLNIAREHLLAAKENSELSQQCKALLRHIESEIDQLESHAPLKDELAEFVKNKDKNLKHVRTEVVDHVADLRAKLQQQKSIDTIDNEVDDAVILDHLLVGLDIASFDKRLLRHVDTDEGTSLQDAKLQYQLRDMDDSLVHGMKQDRTVNVDSIIRDPQLSDLTTVLLTNDNFASMGTSLTQAMVKNDKNAISQLANQLGQLIGDDIKNAPKDIQLGFATSRGEDLKNDLLHVLASQSGSFLPELAGNYNTAGETVKQFLDEAYSISLTRLNDRVEGDVLHIDGLQFTKSQQIGEGAFGIVSIYTAQDNNGKLQRVVVKEPIPSEYVVDDEEAERQKAFDLAANESRAHRSASEGDSQNIVPFRTAIPTPDGRLLIAMDLAEHGDVAGFSENLKNAVNSGAVPQHIANLVRTTLLMDMANGLRHLQESRGMTHIDIKPQNFFISGNGITQLGDFGLAESSLERTFTSRPLDGTLNISPELVSGDEAVGKMRSDITLAINKLKKAIAEQVPKLPVQDQQKATQSINEQIQRLNKIGNEQTFTVNEKADTFSLGMAAYGLFKGKDFVDSLTDSTFDPERATAIKDYGESDKSGQLSGTGVTSLDRVLNSMLDPDPSSRLGMTDLLNLSLFNEPGVGTKELRGLITLIADPNTPPSDLKEACEKFGV